MTTENRVEKFSRVRYLLACGVLAMLAAAVAFMVGMYAGYRGTELVFARMGHAKMDRIVRLGNFSSVRDDQGLLRTAVIVVAKKQAASIETTSIERDSAATAVLVQLQEQGMRPADPVEFLFMERNYAGGLFGRAYDLVTFVPACAGPRCRVETQQPFVMSIRYRDTGQPGGPSKELVVSPFSGAEVWSAGIIMVTARL